MLFARPSVRRLKIGANMCHHMCYIIAMKRTNFYYPEQLLKRLKAASEHHGIPMSEIIRRALDAALKKMGF